MHSFIEQLNRFAHSRYTLWALLLIPVILFFVSVVALAPDAPWWDEYDSTISYLAYPAPERFLHLLDFHNEHRLVFPRLIFEILNLFPGRISFLSCIVLGDCILLGYVVMWGGVYRHQVGLSCFVPFVWIFLDLANCENTLWGLTAIQSHAVLFFALASTLAFARRKSRVMFVFSLVLALLSTMTSASGLGIWPALVIGALIGDRPVKGRIRDALIVGAIGAIVIIFYMHGFFAATTAHTEGQAWTLNKAIDFLLCFLGNVVPIASVARVLGVCSLVATGYIIFNWKRLSNEPVFIFFLYLQSITASGVLVRSCMEGSGLFYRLEVIAISIFCSEAYLILRLLKGGNLFAIANKTLRVSIFVAIAANLLAIVGGAAFLLERKRQIEDGYHAWPQDRTRLPAGDVSSADKALQRYVDRIEGKIK